MIEVGDTVSTTQQIIPCDAWNPKTGEECQVSFNKGDTCKVVAINNGDDGKEYTVEGATGLQCVLSEDAIH